MIADQDTAPTISYIALVARIVTPVEHVLPCLKLGAAFSTKSFTMRRVRLDGSFAVPTAAALALVHFQAILSDCAYSPAVAPAQPSSTHA